MAVLLFVSSFRAVPVGAGIMGEITVSSRGEGGDEGSLCTVFHGEGRLSSKATTEFVRWLRRLTQRDARA